MTEIRSILHQILNVPGAIGAMVYGSDGAVLAADFPEQYPPGALQRMARLLSEDFLVQQAMEGDEASLDLRYAGGRVILRPFARGAILALCGGTVNAQLVNLALQQASHRLEKALPTAAAPAAVPPVIADPVRPAVLSALKQAFLTRMGPIGELIFSRAQAEWSADPGGRGLEGLVSRIAGEFDDPAEQKAFLREARAITG